MVVYLNVWWVFEKKTAKANFEFMLTKESLDCPHCLSSKVVEKRMEFKRIDAGVAINSFKKSIYIGGAEKKNKNLAIRMLIRGFGIRDIAYVLGISTGCVLRVLVSQASLTFSPTYKVYHKLQVDELYSFVQNKKKKVWIMDAICLLCPNWWNTSTNDG